VEGLLYFLITICIKGAIFCIGSFFLFLIISAIDNRVKMRLTDMVAIAMRYNINLDTNPYNLIKWALTPIVNYCIGALYLILLVSLILKANRLAKYDFIDLCEKQFAEKELLEKQIEEEKQKQKEELQKQEDLQRERELLIREREKLENEYNKRLQ
jgi:hypothetical protein